ncbi:MAG: sulfurtransferase TusA family protein [Gammaproteobacteria bacterium]|nr:sulfurtransferase TusA family protein [Gammaproteobacteria bacterium]NIR98087.1 sulfurtransferase TusA family protein [Gammaproteobacteria bacterium]NIT63425.1 sulfurtransferase TusA family protein [Gammaproteobacteria bacterium]NIV20332.1 SirA family protein [Gammaproteobacteria bacterium]NIX10809.1 SirA family protein [Gammaproteobacteria bacterium]
MAHHQLDARRLLCPMPVIRVQHRAAQLAPGDLLEVICTDPGAANDIPAWCRVHGHTVVEVAERGSEIVITIEIGASE